MSYEIRQSQVIHTWPAGSIIDFPELSLIMLCHDDSYTDWGRAEEPNKKQCITDDRLAGAFNVDHFVIPPIQDGINILSAYGIRFPASQYCPKCGLIHSIKRSMGTQIINGNTLDQGMKAFTCSECTNNQTAIGPKLIPMRFVIATEEGFLGDFPWDWFVHKGCEEERGKGHYLYYKSTGGSAGLSDIKIESRRRENGERIATRDLGKIFDQEIFLELDKFGKHYLDYVHGYLPKPWKGWHNDTTYVTELVSDIPSAGNIYQDDEITSKSRRKFPRTLQRGAGNIIFPIIYSGILLPRSTYEQQCPPDVQRKIEAAIGSLTDAMPDTYGQFGSEEWKTFFIEQLESGRQKQLLAPDYLLVDVKQFIQNHFGSGHENKFVNKAVLLRQQEYKAFTGPIQSDNKVWFKKRIIEGNKYNLGICDTELLDQVILLDKLSTLKVYKGFTRVKPLMGEEMIFAEATDNLTEQQKQEFQRIQDARRDPLNTKELPGVEIKGEGLFLNFNNQTLNRWSADYPQDRLNTINNNLRRANLDFGQNQSEITKRYLFLHTFSHILLKELSEDCGYSLSSLSEIIYCSADDKIGTEEEMNAILIYTTTADSEGSLGGLVEKGAPSFLTKVIKKGIDKARWCSSDPLCVSVNQGQGFLGLNLAACYSCVLLPETSCEKMNKYLDRAALIGTLDSAEIGFFKQN
jgi:hypothetical protein